MGSNPGWTQGQVPTPGQWNDAFSAKQDNLTFSPLNKAGDTVLGPLLTTASVTAAAGFNIPPGTTPAAPNNGDIWNTGSALFIQIGSASIAVNTYNGATLQVTPPAPAGTTNGTGVMMGLGAVSGSGCILTPLYSKRVQVTFEGYISINGTGAFTATFYNGTGAAPVNGTALAGSLVGTSILGTSTASGQKIPFHLTALLTGLTVNTPYWFDIALATTNATATIGGVSCTAFEI